MKPLTPFAPVSPELEADLYRLNPWWQGRRQAPLPPIKRWAFSVVPGRLKTGLTKITVVRGPRQVGKSTLMLQIVQSLLDEGVDPKRIFYVQFDDLPEALKLSEPILRLADWFEHNLLGSTFNEATHEGRPVFLFLDEVQNVESWAPQLKFLVDTSAVRVMVTGSSALRIEQGRDSLAGRISTLDMGPLFLREIAEIRGYGSMPAYLSFNGLALLRDKQFWLELRQFGLTRANSTLIYG